MNRKQITITLAGLGIMAIAAVGCASNAVSADDELNIDNTPVIGAPAEPNTDPNDSVEHLNPSTPDETGIFPTEDPNAESGDVIDYPSSTLASATANFRYLSSQATASATVRFRSRYIRSSCQNPMETPPTNSGLHRRQQRPPYNFHRSVRTSRRFPSTRSSHLHP